MSEKRIVVVGGAGFIGSQVVIQLLAAGYSVDVVDICAKKLQHESPCLRLYQQDMEDVVALAKICKYAYAVIYAAGIHGDIASIVRPEKTWFANVQGVYSVLEAVCRASVRRFIYLSSSLVYGSAPLPHHEAVFSTAVSIYGEQKLTAELQIRLCARAYGLEAIVLRVFDVYGYGMYSGTFSSAISKFFNSEKTKTEVSVYGDGSQICDYVHVTDVAHACLLSVGCLDISSGCSVVNIGTGVGTSIKSLAETYFSHVAIRYHDVRIQWIQESVASIDVARKLLGWSPTVSLEEGVALTRASMQK